MVRVLIFITCSLRIIEVSLKNEELRSGFSCCAQTTFRFAQNIPFSLKFPFLESWTRKSPDSNTAKFTKKALKHVQKKAEASDKEEDGSPSIFFVLKMSKK
jgi:hypothetical protein